MTYEELRVQLDINDSVEVLKSAGKLYAKNKWFVICDDGDCHLFKDDGIECDVREVKWIDETFISKSIKKIVIPSGVMRIESWAFSGCRSLANVVIPDNVTSIMGMAFYGCTGLTSMMIPDSVKRIGFYAFSGCSSLKEVVFKGKSLEEVKAMNNYSLGIRDESIIKYI